MNSRSPFPFVLQTAIVLAASVLVGHQLFGQEEPMVPPLQIYPQPYSQAAFVFVPIPMELVRFHFGGTLFRPFLYPIRSPSGRELTRMGHPHDPISHSHHNSVWMSHADVNNSDFWSDRTEARIVCRNVVEYGEQPGTPGQDGSFPTAWLLADIEWVSEKGTPLLKEERRITLQLFESAEKSWRNSHSALAGGYLIIIDSSFRPATESPVTFGQTPFGLIGVRMTKTIGVRDGGGRILNSEGGVNEKGTFRLPARWMDYSGPVTVDQKAGITLFDHPNNPGFPNPFHVRDDGWMGICLTLNGPITLEKESILKLRYGLWCHDGVPGKEEIDNVFGIYSRLALPGQQRQQ
ncbi:MAG TPA: PmoA family protein [Thermogutta sp.]|nr:PmoA family protein [Thermogutta sp.]HQF14147.1 PmoA family protein [Thermogutta sp.]